MNDNNFDQNDFACPNPWRMMGAFAFFLISIAGFLWVVMHKIPSLSTPLELKKKLSLNASEEDSSHSPIFYNSVGVAPFLDPPETFHIQPLEEELRILSSESKELNQLANGAVDEVLPRAYTIEIAALTDKAKAEQLVESLKSKSFQAFYTPLLSQDYVIYRVRVGIFESFEQAQNRLPALSKHLKNSPSITVLQ